MTVEKNKEYIVDIIDNGFEGEGIAKIEGFTIFVPNSLKGERVRILIVKVLSSHAFGKVLEIIEKSDLIILYLMSRKCLIKKYLIKIILI